MATLTKRIGKPSGIVIHHSLTKDGNTVSWDAIKKYHMEENGWADIGYHGGCEVIDGKLTGLTGRPVDTLGGHTVGRNNMLGFCFVGNFDVTTPSDEVLEFGAKYVAGWCRMFDIPVEKIHRHSETAPKTCPGINFPWTKFITMVKKEI